MSFENKIFVGTDCVGNQKVYKLYESGWVENVKNLNEMTTYLKRVLPPLSEEEKHHVKGLFHISA